MRRNHFIHSVLPFCFFKVAGCGLSGRPPFSQERMAYMPVFAIMDNLTSYQLNEAIAAAISNAVNSEAFKAYIRSLTV